MGKPCPKLPKKLSEKRQRGDKRKLFHFLWVSDTTFIPELLHFSDTLFPALVGNVTASGSSQAIKRELTLLAWFLVKGISFNSADHPLLKLYHDISSWNPPPSRKRLAGCLLNSLHTIVAKRNKRLLEEANFFSITSDAWTSAAQQKFVGVTIHFLTRSFKMRSLVLAVIPLNASHTWQRVTEVVAQRIMDATLRHAVLVSSVTDGGANFVKMSRSLMSNMVVAATEGEELDSWDVPEPGRDEDDAMDGMIILLSCLPNLNS